MSEKTLFDLIEFYYSDAFARATNVLVNRGKLIDAIKARDDALEQQHKVELNTKAEIVRQAGGSLKDLGPNQAAQQDELERRMAQNDVLGKAKAKLASCERDIQIAQNEIAFNDDCAKAARAALHALGGLSER